MSAANCTFPAGDVFTYCDGEIRNGYCMKCLQPSYSTNMNCGRLIPAPNVTTDGTFMYTTEKERYALDFARYLSNQIPMGKSFEQHMEDFKKLNP